MSDLLLANKIGVSVYCEVCGKQKKPRGRSASPCGPTMCDYECQGYMQEPRVGDLWPGESEANFGYLCSNYGTHLLALPESPEEYTDEKLKGLWENMEKDKLFYIQDARNYAGNSVLWWRVDGRGYTTNLDEAWKVPEEKALQMQRNRASERAWPCEEIDRLASRQFDMQLFLEVKGDDTE